MSQDEKDLLFFKNAMKTVKPLKKNNYVQHQLAKPPPKPLRNTHQQDSSPVSDYLSDGYEPDDINAGDILSYQRSGVQKKIFRKLRNGKFYTRDELDLHGLTALKARQLLTQYLDDIYIPPNCCIRIVHGKGHRSQQNAPVLKRKLNHWLRQHPRVVAFHSAIQRHGGTGAVYVLLKSKH